MTFEQIMILVVLGVMLVSFALGKLRFEVTAMLGLVASVLLGLVPAGDAFNGFGHNAVITVIGILIIGQGLFESGFVERLVEIITKYGKSKLSRNAILFFGVALFSSMMNNIGALALFMPVAIKMSRQDKESPSNVLMPLAFSSLLGGMITLIGSPPNIIISTVRQDYTGKGFAMFDFAPLGLSLTVIVVLFILFFGKHFIPNRTSKVTTEDLFNIRDYTTVVKVTPESLLVNKRIVDLPQELFHDLNIVGFVRKEEKYDRITPYMIIHGEDRLIIEADMEKLGVFMKKTGVSLATTKHPSLSEMTSEDSAINEVVVNKNSSFVGKTAKTMNLRSVYGVNLIAVSREGERLTNSPNRILLQGGDVLLLQGPKARIQEVINDTGVLPLVSRKVNLSMNRRSGLAISIFAIAIALVTFNVLPATISFSLGALMMVMTGILTPETAYQAIDLPIVLLLGALIPISEALETTGTALIIAEKLTGLALVLPSWGTLLLLLVITMILTNIINNAAAALLLAPIAIGIAQSLGHSIDPYLMSVFVGAASAYLTPIGHASCTVVMGPGGYRFGDYWKLGLPVSLLTCFIAIPVIMIFFPF